MSKPPPNPAHPADASTTGHETDGDLAAALPSAPVLFVPESDEPPARTPPPPPQPPVLTRPSGRASTHPGAASESMGSMPLVDVSAPLLDNQKSDLTLFSSMGGYRIERLLGEGAMGKVYLAEHEMLSRPAAIKVLHAEHANPEAVERFFQEARAASAINHPGIVNVYDVGENDEGSYLVMELLEGESLEDRLLREEQLGITDAVRFAVQVASALQAAHENGIVHRDLKPGNLFISPDPEVSGGERIKILDFGIAKVTGGARDANTSQTRSDMIVGSPTYMSPEQCRGAQHVDGRADLYSLGCILFEMICGRPPFDQQVMATVIAAHLREEAPKPTEFRPEVSPALETIILKLLAKDADERYADAQSFIDAVVVQGGHSLVVKTGATRTLLGATRFFSTMVTEPKRRPLGLLVLAALVGAIALAVVMLSGGGDEDEVAQVEERPEDWTPEAQPEVERPPPKITMLADPEAEPGAEQSETVIAAIQNIEAMSWDEEVDEEKLAQIAKGELDISALGTSSLIKLGPDGKPLVPWFINSVPAGASVVDADGKPLFVGAKTPLFVEWPAADRTEKIIVRLEGYEDEVFDGKYFLPLKKKLTLVEVPEVTLRSDPEGADVYDGDGTKLGPTPYTTKLSRSAKSRKLSLRLEGYEDDDFVLKGGMTLDEPRKLQPLTEVTIATKPKRVEILENGAVIAKTPYTTKYSVKKGPGRVLTLHYDDKYEDEVVTLGPGGTSGEILDSRIELLKKVKREVRTRKARKVVILDETGAEFQKAPWTTYLSRKDPPRQLVLHDPAGKYEDFPFTLGAEVELPRKIAMVKVPILKVDSKPKKAEIIGADGQSMGVTPIKIPLSSKVGTMQLTLRKAGYDDLPITLKYDEKPPRRYQLAKLPTIEVVTKPRKATVYGASGKELGTTPLDLSFGADKGPLSLTLRKNGFEDYELRVPYGEKPPKRIDMVALESAVTLKTDPKGVEVFAGSDKLGKTPLQIGMKRGSAPKELTLRKSGYAEQSVTVRFGEDLPKKIRLVKLAVIKLESKPSGATVYDGAGTELGKTPHVLEVPRSRTKLSFKLELAGYEPRTVKVEPKRDRKERVSLVRQKREVTVEISSVPVGARVEVKRKKVGVTPFKLTRMESSGTTSYVVRLKDHQKQKLRVKNNADFNKLVELEKCGEGTDDDEDVVDVDLANPYASEKCDD